DRLPVLGIAGLVLGWAGVLGRLFLAALHADRFLSRLDRFVFSLAVGLNLLSTWTLAAGLAGRLDRLFALGLPGLATLGAVGLVYRRRKALSGGPPRPAPRLTADQRQTPPSDEGPLSTRWLWLAVPFAVTIVLGGMLPPIEFDVREYHLQAPKEFFQQGHIGFVPHNLYANMALGTEMLSLLAMIVAGDWWLGALAGKTIIAAMAPLGALALWAAGRRLFSNSAGVVAAVVYLSTGWIVQVSSLGMVEGASAMYLLLAVYAVLLARGERDPLRKEQADSVPLLLLAGYCAGAAVSSKYPGVLFVALPLTIWLLVAQVHRNWRSAWKPVGVFLLACFAGCGLWFGKNWVLAGNPTYPLAYRVFGGKTWTPEKNAMWNRVHQPHDFSATALGHDLVRVVLASDWLGPLCMPLAILALVRREHRRLAALLAGYFVFVILAWWLTALRIDRYWSPGLALVALLAGVGAGWDRSRAWRWSLVALLLLASLYNFLVAVAGPGGYNRFFVSYARLRDAPERVDAWCRYFNVHAAGGRVLLVGQAEVFDFEMPVLYNTWLDDSIFERLVENRTPEEVREAFQREGITHVFVHWGEIARYRRTGYGRWDFVRPEVFDRLVDAGVLEPLPDLPNHPGRGYRVRCANKDRPASNSLRVAGSNVVFRPEADRPIFAGSMPRSARRWRGATCEVLRALPA
ncbi:MAG: phospholipid carrier-dependent glycosyltransferase, partial [Thermoguttaceae bacterium]|nr:phospholipid carrier-dependent glycosyltransferase [Thermoguttaceae bacterium]